MRSKNKLYTTSKLLSIIENLKFKNSELKKENRDLKRINYIKNKKALKYKNYWEQCCNILSEVKEKILNYMDILREELSDTEDDWSYMEDTDDNYIEGNNSNTSDSDSNTSDSGYHNSIDNYVSDEY